MPFPYVSTLIDDFNRANGAVNAGAGSTIWSGSHLNGAASALTVTSNQLATTGGGSTLLTFGPNVDFQFDVPVLPTAGQYFAFWWNISDPRTANFDAYSLTFLTTGAVWRVSKWINGSSTILGTPSSTLTAGDKVGIRQRDTAIEFLKFTAGAWSQVATLTADGTVPIVNGPVSVEFGDTTVRIDNLSGGTASVQDTTGATFPSSGTTVSSGTESAEAWVNPGNIVSDNATEAQITAATFDSPDISQRLTAKGFGFSIPSGATIEGVVAEIDRRSIIASSGKDFRVQLLDETGTIVGTNKAVTGTIWPTTSAVASYGSRIDIWGWDTVTPDKINDVDFGLVLSASANIANADIGVDFIRLTVYYQPAAASPSTISLLAATGVGT